MMSLLPLLLALLPAAPAGALEVPLRYERNPAKPAGFVPRGTGMAAVSRERPPGEWKLPALKAEEPLFARVALGDRRHLIVLDKPAAEAKVYSRLLIDAGGDGDLTSDEWLEGTEPRRAGAYRMLDFPPVDMKLLLDGREVPYSFKVRFYHPEELPRDTAGGRQLNLYLDLNCSWRGEFELEGLGRFRAALGDAGGNGRFDDGCRPGGDARQNPDFLYLTDGDEITPYDMIHAGRVLVVRGRTFALRIDIAAGKLVLDPAAGELPEVRLAMPVDRMSLACPGGGAALFGCAGEVGLPPGTYTLLSYLTTKADEGGGLWRLWARAGRPGPRVEAGAEGAALAFGEPFTASVRLLPAPAPREGQPAPKPRLDFNLAGAGGEQLATLDLLTPGKTSLALSAKRRTRPEEPTFMVTAPDGAVLAEGAFEYG